MIDSDIAAGKNAKSGGAAMRVAAVGVVKTRHTLHVTRHASHITRHTSLVTRRAGSNAESLLWLKRAMEFIMLLLTKIRLVLCFVFCVLCFVSCGSCSGIAFCLTQKCL